MAALLLTGCGVAKSGPKVYSAGFEYTDSSAIINPLVQKGNDWKKAGEPIVLTFERQEGAVTTVLDSLRTVDIQGAQYVQLSYLNSYNGGKNWIMPFHLWLSRTDRWRLSLSADAT